MSKHYEFIQTPISAILKDVILANSGIGSGFETFPLRDYVFQSIFLKMTGFQEQKMKCISWEMATNDYDYRRILLGDDDRLGECSTYESKNKIFKRLLFLIEKKDANFELDTALDTTAICRNTINEIKTLFTGTNLSIWNSKSFSFFISKVNGMIKPIHFSHNKKNLFENVLQDLYKDLYSHRNRCAHNTLSYQENLPTLKTLSASTYPNKNYFIWFCLLIIIDAVFISLYDKYQNVLEEQI